MVWLPCNQDAGLGARGQRGQGVVNRPQKQRPVTWRRKGPMLEWGVGPGRKPRRAGTSEAEGSNSEPPAAQGREASLQPSTGYVGGPDFLGGRWNSPLPARSPSLPGARSPSRPPS